jgi:hypothetical protein
VVNRRSMISAATARFCGESGAAAEKLTATRFI